MNTQKKRIVVYSILLFCVFILVIISLQKKKPLFENIIQSSKVDTDSLITVSLLSEFYDIENIDDTSVSKEKFVSGKKSYKINSLIEYGFPLRKTLREIPSYSKLNGVSVKFNCLQEKEFADALFVLSIDDKNGKNVFWDGKPIGTAKSNEWIKVTADFKLTPEALNPDNSIVAYVWNRNKKELYIDDIAIDYKGLKVMDDKVAVGSAITNLFFDLEAEAGLSGNENIISTVAHSGKKACDLSGGKEYGPSYNKKIGDLGSEPHKKISLSLWVYPLTDNPNTVLTASVVNSKDETIFWEGKSTENKPFPKEKWTKINASYYLPTEKFSSEDMINIGVWNKGKTDVIVDDLEIVFGESPERRGNPSTIDAIAIYEKRFVGEKNKPPFRTIFFEKQEIKNANTTFITRPSKNTGPANFSPNDEYLVGDFSADKNNLDEIICIKNNVVGMFSYFPEEKEFKKIWETDLANDSLWSNNNKAYSGDHNTDGKPDILLVNKKTNAFKIIYFNNKNWVVSSFGSKTNKEWTTKKENPKGGIVGATDQLFSGNFIGGKKMFLKLNEDWRFDLKLIEQDKNGYTILGNIDFKGYPNDCNPKYYEFIKMVTGNFLIKNQTSLLVVMSNCADPEFSGRHCTQTESLPTLPNKTELYNLMNWYTLDQADVQK